MQPKSAVGEECAVCKRPVQWLPDAMQQKLTSS
jgi:hypothetical protein